MQKINHLLSTIVILVFSVLTGCDGGAPKLTVEGARAELSPVMRGEGLVYLKIVNTGGKDVLMEVKTDIPGSTADLHEMKGNFMVLTQSLPIPGKGALELHPMASHIMIENMPRNVKEGYPFTLTLVLKKSGALHIPLVLMKAQPMMHEH